MLYAKVVLGLAVEGPFDYSVPRELEKKISPGVRVKVNFCNRLKLAYVVGVSHNTRIKRVKPILEAVDDSPILDKGMLFLTQALADYYCCSWGEAIETALPQGLRQSRVLPAGIPGDNLTRVVPYLSAQAGSADTKGVLLIHDLSGQGRWDIYLGEIKAVLACKRSVIIILPDIDEVKTVRQTLELMLGVKVASLYRKQTQELSDWAAIKQGRVDVVVGTRSAVFAPLGDLGLVIIDEEHDSVYKQDQVPHYHARDVALMRTGMEKARLILGSASPSLEIFHLVKGSPVKNRGFEYRLIPRQRKFPEIKVIDTRGFVFTPRKGNRLLSRYLEDAILAAINAKGKVLLFLNRKGFATSAACLSCGKILKCPRCNINLVYHFDKEELSCHHCSFKMPAPRICPSCLSGYIKYSGTGTEKVESELSRLFPQARIKREDDKLSFLDKSAADIFISTSLIIKMAEGPHFPDAAFPQTGPGACGSALTAFDLIAVLAIDNSLNRIDYRATEKTFAVLSGLLGLTDKMLVVQTGYPEHHCFRALEKNDVNVFYTGELKQRKQLHFPPYQHLCLVKLRGKLEPKVKEAGETIFAGLIKRNTDKGIKIISVNPGIPEKLRGNFYYQVLLRSRSALKMSAFLKKHLKSFLHSGIIVTVDMDPV